MKRILYLRTSIATVNETNFRIQSRGSRAAVFWLRVLIIIKFKTLVSASITQLDCLVLTLEVYLSYSSNYANRPLCL